MKRTFAKSGALAAGALLICSCAGIPPGSAQGNAVEIITMRNCKVGESAGFKSGTTDWHCCNNVVFVAEGESNIEATAVRGIGGQLAFDIAGTLAAAIKARNFTGVSVDVRVEKFYVAQHWFREHCATHTPTQQGGCEDNPEFVKRKIVLRGRAQVNEQLGVGGQLQLKALFASLGLDATIDSTAAGTVVESGVIEKCEDEAHAACAKQTRNTNLTLGPDRTDAGTSPWTFAGSPEGVIPPTYDGGTSPDAGTPDAGTPLGCAPTGNPCQDCVGERCCGQIKTCLESQSCAQAYATLQQCLRDAREPGDRGACWEIFSMNQAGRPLISCANERCSTVCF